jgi:anti-anti-sigma regulatory factor
VIVISKELNVEIDYNINSNSSDISRLIEIQYKFLNEDYNRLVLNFTDANFIDAAVAVIIGTLCVYAHKVGKTVKFRFKNGGSHPVFRLMKQIGMYRYFTKSNKDLTTRDAVPFNQISDEDAMEEYTNTIMELAPITMQDEAKDILSSYFFEVYQNALYHAKSPIDIFSSGYWMRKRRELTFSVYDMGIGIPQNIRIHTNEKMSSKQCIEWALTEGKSTIEDELIKRGLGLSRLEEFIKLNKGTMSVYSDDICCIINESGRKFIELNVPIKGTLIIINIIADTQHIYIVN